LLSIFNEKESENNWEKFNNALKQFKELSAQMVTSSDYNDILKSFSGAILNSVYYKYSALYIQLFKFLLRYIRNIFFLNLNKYNNIC